MIPQNIISVLESESRQLGWLRLRLRFRARYHGSGRLRLRFRIPGYRHWYTISSSTTGPRTCTSRFKQEASYSMTPTCPTFNNSALFSRCSGNQRKQQLLLRRGFGRAWHYISKNVEQTIRRTGGRWPSWSRNLSNNVTGVLRFAGNFFVFVYKKAT